MESSLRGISSPTQVAASPVRIKRARLDLAIAATLPGSYILVPAEHARLYQKVKPDGRVYFVQNPDEKWVYHVTNPDGTTERVDARGGVKSRFPGDIQFLEKRVQGAKRRARKGQRTADKLLKSMVVARPNGPPEVCLIDITRVMLITGFKKSFIYEHQGFPAPVTWGNSKRAASRWVEEEVIKWCKEAIEARQQKQTTQTQHSE